jgi:dipeptidyl aminopeptidase/acylaminoacyl peptidase
MQNRLATIKFALVLAANAAFTQQPAPNSMAEFMQQLGTATDYLETSISPDHRLIAWVQSTPSAAGAVTAGSAIFFAPIDRPTATARVTAIKAEDHGSAVAIDEKNIAWAPDSASLAFLSDAESPGQRQLYLMRMADHSVRRLTQLKGYLATPRWSPDGREIAFLFTDNAVRAAGPLAAAAPVVGIVDEHIYEQRIATVDLAGGKPQQISPGDLYVYEYDWSPDGTQFAATAAHGSGDNNWYVAELYSIDTATGAARSLIKPRMQIAVPRWSPDGRWIAYIGGLMSDEGIASGDVYLIPAGGGETRNLTPALPGSAYWLAWRPNSRDMVLAEALAGGTGLAQLDTRTGALHLRWQGEETIRGPADFARGISLASDGESSAVIRESFDHPPAVWSGRIGAWTLVAAGTGAKPGGWGKAESVQWRSDEFSVQGWLLPPASVDPTRKYPMVVWIHGGPAWLTSPSWPAPLDDSRVVLLATRGYYVFFPNPRGSAGSGENFKRANVKDFGGGDLRDILAGIRQVVATRPVDDRRIGLAGWSYGGYMTMWALTQTQRFGAAVVGAGVSDWLSYYGENGVDEVLIPYFGASVYDDPAVYAKSSPINYVKNVKTPTLLMVGDSDVECPPPQSYEYWHALKTFKVDTQLVIYPHEGHQFTDPAHALDVMQRMVAWFDDHMPAYAKP